MGANPRWSLLAAAVAAAALALPAPASAERPNVLHILTDDQTVDSLAQMPILQRELVDEGTRFKNHHSTQPLCCPSRASFLTGQYPHNHGVLSNSAPFGYGAMDFDRTIYTALDGAGYKTGWLGKILNARGEQGQEPEPGFDEWLVRLGAGESGSMFDYVLSDNGRRRIYRDEFQNTVLTRRAREFIADATERPFLLTVAYHSPHWTRCPKTRERCGPQPAPRDLDDFGGTAFPFRANFPPSPAQRTRTSRYWGHELESLQSVDRAVGTLLEDLRASGELENTLIVFQSDNGLLHGEHGIFDKDIPWDRSVRVPLVVRGPGFAAGETRTDLTANVDVPATILEATGVDPPVPQDGHSLTSGHRRNSLLLERLIVKNENKREPWLQLKTARGYTYWRDLDGGRPHLFDLRSDPNQIRGLSRSRPRLVKRLDRRLRRISDCANPCP